MGINLQLNTGSYKVIYVYTINDGQHDGRVKVGDATYHTSLTLSEILEKSKSRSKYFIETEEITQAAINRIDQQTKTADVKYELLWSALAVRPKFDEDSQEILTYESFRDYDLHNILKRSGVTKDFARSDKRSGEWFTTTVDHVKKAFESLCEGKDSFIDSDKIDIVLRDEQKDAVDCAARKFRKGSIDNPKRFLWNAIMRFGKTLTSYALVEKLQDKDDIKKVLILTHRPVVKAGWHEDFKKYFGNNSEWSFGTKSNLGDTWESLQKSERFIYFASVQDLRGSFNIPLYDDETGEIINADTIFKKNSEVFDAEFDLAVYDESHEGLKTELAQLMDDSVKSKYKLFLSGTPFNIIEDFDNDSVYTWSYLDEQKAKEDWDRKYEAFLKDPSENSYPGSDTNPYGKLPRLEIRTFDTVRIFKDNPAIDPSGVSFNFNKFFEVDRSKVASGSVYPKFHPFKDAASVDTLLNMISTSDENGRLDESSGNIVEDHRNFPFSRDNSKKDFAHTFWVLPSVEASVALHERLNAHPNFSDFKVINATGDNDSGDPLSDVKKAIKENERTITLSVGKLTTGTTVPEWTGVFMLSNMKSPMSYMQTIFRVKSSGSLPDGREKEVGYVFDFAPDRALEMAQVTSSHNSRKSIKDYDILSFNEQEAAQEKSMKEMLSYLPIIAYDGAQFTKADTNFVMKTLQKVYINRAVDSGFCDSSIFRFDIQAIDKEDMERFTKLTSLIGASSKDSAIKRLVISESKLTGEDKKILESPEPDKKTDPEANKKYQEALEKLHEDRKNGQKIMQLLRGISARIPMLVFATELEKDITLDTFSEIIDDESWAEFMPKGFTKEDWSVIKEYFNKTVFEGACSEIKNRTDRFSKLSIVDRVAAVAQMFSSFTNPDKETILTPFSVVNRQYADTLGGLRMVDNDGKWYAKDARSAESGSEVKAYSWMDIEDSSGDLILEPQWIDTDEDLVKFWKSPETTILDINSKTALYPLYGALSLFVKRKEVIQENLSRFNPEFKPKVSSDEEIWRYIVENQIFVNCRVPYSRKIAERVLAGYEDMRVNASVVDVMIVRNALKEFKLQKYHQHGTLAKGLRNLTEDETNEIWKWIFNPTAMKTITEDGRTMTEVNAEKIIKLAEDSNPEAAERLLEEIMKADKGEKFASICSNPPYQMHLGGNNPRSLPVWHEFFDVSKVVSEIISIISPARWRISENSLEREIKEKLIIEEKRISLISIYDPSEQIFSNTLIRDGVNVIFWNLRNTKKTRILLNNVELINKNIADSFYKEEGIKIFNKIGLPSVTVLDQKYFISRREDLREAIKNYSESKTLTNSTRTLSVFGGLGTRQSFKWISDEPYTRNRKSFFSKYKLGLIGFSDNFGERAFLLKPDEALGENAKFILFSSSETAENFRSYLKTKFAIELMKATISGRGGCNTELLPDLAEVTNPRTGLVGYESDWTDEDLKIIFKDVLAEDDWVYIEKATIETDPVGAKK